MEESPIRLDPDEVARMLAGSRERLHEPLQRDDPEVILGKLREIYDADPRLSELRRTMLDAGLELVWEIRVPAPHSPTDDLSDCAHGCNGDCLTSGSEVCNFTCHAV